MPKGLYNFSKGQQIYPIFPIYGSQKFTQTGIFGLKINHLATLLYVLPSLFSSSFMKIVSLYLFQDEADVNKPATKNNVFMLLTNAWAIAQKAEIINDLTTSIQTYDEMVYF
jgi:hypothetical protein